MYVVYTCIAVSKQFILQGWRIPFAWEYSGIQYMKRREKKWCFLNSNETNGEMAGGADI